MDGWNGYAYACSKLKNQLCDIFTFAQASFASIFQFFFLPISKKEKEKEKIEAIGQTFCQSVRD